MKTLHHKLGERQRPCFTILHRSCFGKSHFRGDFILEDGRFYWASAFIATGKEGLEYLRLHLQPAVRKNPIDPYPERFITLDRTPPNRPDWESDFKGSVLLEGSRFYSIGVSVRTDSNGAQYLRLFLRPEHN